MTDDVDEYEKLAAMFSERTHAELVAIAAVQTQSLDLIRIALGLPAMTGAGGMLTKVVANNDVTTALKAALRECGQGHAHFTKPHTVKGGFFHATMHGPTDVQGGPCMCRWCKARRLLDNDEQDALDATRLARTPEIQKAVKDVANALRDHLYKPLPSEKRKR